MNNFNSFYYLSENSILIIKIPDDAYIVYSLTDLPGKVNVGLCSYCSSNQKTHSKARLNRCEKVFGFIESYISNKNRSLNNFDELLIIIAFCKKCGKYRMNIYSENWEWIDEINLLNTKDCDKLKDISEINKIKLFKKIINNSDELKKIPEDVLELFFSKQEIKTLFDHMSGKKVRRQYLYRARKKAEKMENVLNIKINI